LPPVINRNATKIRKPAASHPSVPLRSDRNNATKPTISTMLSTGPTASITLGTRARREVDEVDPPAAMFAATCSIGKPWIVCQTRFGAAISSAIATATHSFGLRRWLRGPQIATPRRQHASSGAARTLISVATPVSTPATIQGVHRCGSLRIARTNHHTAAAVASMSNVVVSNRCPTAKVSAVSATAAEAAT
jgi:hypothetical protein